MSARPVRGFLPVLRAFERDLTAPVPARVRILRELEFDLEMLRDRLIAEGLPADAASSRAVEPLVPDGPAIRALERVHAPRYRRLTAHLSGGRLRLAERGSLALGIAAVLVLGTRVVVRAGVFDYASPFLWLLLVVSAPLLAAVAAKVFQLWVKQDYRQPARGLGLILALSAATFAAGIFAVLVDFLQVASTLERAPELADALAPVAVVRGSAVLSIAILIALAGGLAWLLLHQWLALVSGAYREVLGLDSEPRL